MSNDIKKTWQGIRLIKNPNFPQVGELNGNGGFFYGSKDIAEKINEFFVNIGLKRNGNNKST